MDRRKILPGLNRTAPLANNLYPGDYRIVLDRLLGWWKHDEGSGTVLKNHPRVRVLPGNGPIITPAEFDGTIQGANFWDNVGPNGSPVGTYDGFANYVNAIGNEFSMHNGELSIMVALYIDDVTDKTLDIIMSKCSPVAGTYQWAFHRRGVSDPDELAFYFISASGNQTFETSNAKFVNATWYILTLTYTYGIGSSIRVWRDLTECTGSWIQGNGNSSPVAGSADDYVQIGGCDNSIPGDDSSSSFNFEGRIGDILLYNKILSWQEITKNNNVLRNRYR